MSCVTDSVRCVILFSFSAALSSSAPLQINTKSLANGLVGSPYLQNLIATGGVTPYTWRIDGGRLPVGLTLNPSTGQISGTPIQPVYSGVLSISVTDAGTPAQTATASLTLTIPGTLAITTTSLPHGQVGVPYFQRLTAPDGIPPLRWQLEGGFFPLGLTLDPATGVLSGTPAVAGTSGRLAVMVTDSFSPPRVAMASFTLTIDPASAPPVSPAMPPPSLPTPPAPVVGCYMNTRNGWQSTPCASPQFISSNFPHPDTQLTVTSPNTTPIVFGQIDVTVPQVTSIANVAGGSSTANQWSFQATTNIFAVPGGHSNTGHSAAVQFVVQSNGTDSAICIWNVDVTSQSYPNQCVMPSPLQRSGGLQAFDYANIAGYANSNGTLTMVAELSWVPSGKPNQFAVIANDANGLTGKWTAMSGGLLGLGNGSQAQLSNAEVVTQVLASTCTGDTQAGSPLCTPPTLEPNGSVYVGGTGTVETNNLTALGAPSLNYLNADLEVSNVTATTTGSCLGPGLVYVKDSPQDFGATPSTLGNGVFWESPDIFIVPRGTPVDVNAVSTETTVTPGGLYDAWVRVHNDLGCAPVTGVKTLVYLADPSALSVPWSSITGNNYVGNNGGFSGVTVPASGQALIGPLPFTAPTTSIGNGHKCVLAAIEADGESPPSNSTDAPDSNQVAQRNLQFVSPCVFPLTNATTSDGNVQITLTVTPNSFTPPSLTGFPDIEVTFDDADSSWFNVWKNQAGSGTTFVVTHNGGANTTTIRLGTFSVTLDPVILKAGLSRNATSTINPTSGTLTLQLGATLTDSMGHVLVNNGGSCTVTASIIG